MKAKIEVKNLRTGEGRRDEKSWHSERKREGGGGQDRTREEE